MSADLFFVEDSELGRPSCEPPVSAGVTPDATAAWAEAIQVLTAAVGEMLGLPVGSETEALERPSGGAIAMLPVTLANEGFEVRVRVALDGAGADRICMQLLGGPAGCLEERRDVAREIANLLAGTWKRMAAAESHQCSLGLATDTNDWIPEPTLAHQHWSVSSEGAGLLHVSLELAESKSERLAAAELREGMVLVRDLHDRSGSTLFRGGTRLTQTLLDRLTTAPVLEDFIEVAVAA